MTAQRIVLVALLAALAACVRTPASPTPSPRGAPEVARDSVDVSRTELQDRAEDVFGNVQPAPPAAEPDGDEEGPSWDIDVRSYETHQRVEHYVHMFSGPARERFTAQLERGTRYEAMIREKLRAGGLPEDMYYLALIESGFNPHAYSRAAAVGVWQFMSTTAQGVGLRVDWWVDERRDPVRSTDAAIRFLNWLNEQFGSLYLAAAAYNGGPGRISRGLSRYADDLEGTTGDDLFFALAEKDYLRNETKQYVPQLIAAAIVAKNPEKYGIRVTPQPPFAYDSVMVPPATPLAAVARATGATIIQITDLNPHLLRGMTPPGEPFRVRVPSGTAEGFDAGFAALPEAERSAYHVVKSRKGETLAAIARRERVTERELRWYNPKLRVTGKSGRLNIGQSILVPTPLVLAAARDVPDPRVERYGSSRRVHVVRRGDTLDGIARRYGTTRSKLMRLNGLRKSLIIPGQTLVVKGTPVKRSTPRKGTAKRSGSSNRRG